VERQQHKLQPRPAPTRHEVVVRVKTAGGVYDMSITPAQARLLGKELIVCADSVEGKLNG
jgi:hypothetical protein